MLVLIGVAIQKKQTNVNAMVTGTHEAIIGQEVKWSETKFVSVSSAMGSDAGI